MIRVTFTWRRLRPDPAKPTIAEAMAARLGREATDAELIAEVRRIMGREP